MAELAVTAIGADRPGIIARVTRVLYEHGGNVTDSSMTIIGGHFSIMLLVDTDADPAELERALAAATDDLALGVRVGPAGASSESSPPTHVLTVYGSDRPGIVYQAATALAELGVNVTDLRTRVLAAERDVYACVMEIAVPPSTEPASVVAAVHEASENVEVSIQPLDVETF